VASSVLLVTLHCEAALSTKTSAERTNKLFTAM
jgi:hypothetical protein